MTNSSNLIGHTSMYYNCTSHKWKGHRCTNIDTTFFYSAVWMGDIWTDKMSAYLGTVRGLILLGILFSDLHSNAGSQLHKRIIVTPPGQQDRKINTVEKTSEGIVKSIQGPGLSWRHFYGYQAVTGFFSLQLLCNLFSSALFQHWAPWFTPNNCYQKLFSYLFLVSLPSPFFSFQTGLGTRLICFILSKVYSFFEDQLCSSNEIITEAGILQCVYSLAATEVAFSNPKDTFLIRHVCEYFFNLKFDCYQWLEFTTYNSLIPRLHPSWTHHLCLCYVISLIPKLSQHLSLADSNGSEIRNLPSVLGIVTCTAYAARK